jgi:hypothetical protein
MQVPRGIKNAIHLDRKNGNNLWQEAIKTELMSEGYHSEVDDTPLCTEEDSAKYRSIVGCCIWITVLGRFDIAYATSAMSRFNMSPREGHMKAIKRLLAYLKTFP